MASRLATIRAVGGPQSQRVAPSRRAPSTAHPRGLIDATCRVGRRRAITTALAIVACWVVAEAPARAADVEISSDTAAQAYEVANPWGSNRLYRRRVTEVLGFSMYHLQGDYAPGKADYTARVMMRLDADVGVNAHLPDAQAGGETTFGVAGGSRYVPGLTPARLDMMYAYVEGRNLAHGLLGFRLGRQYMTDVLGLWSFDGGMVRLTTPFFMEVEAYGGLEQRGGLPLSSSRYEQQGVWRGSQSDFGSAPTDPRRSDFPSYQPASVAPAFGFAIESQGPNWIHGRLSYRRVYNTGDTITRQFPDGAGGYGTAGGLRISSDRLGYSAYIGDPGIGGIKGGFTYDFYNVLVPYAFAGLEGYLGKRVTVGADFDYYMPTFDADSIWNWFVHDPQMTPTARVAAKITDRLSLSASGGARMFFTNGDKATFSQSECAKVGLTAAPDGRCLSTSGAPTSFDVVNGAASSIDANLQHRHAIPEGLAQLGLRYRMNTAKLELRSTAEAGARGRRVGGDLMLDKSFVGGMWALGGRLSLYNFHDPTRSATAVGADQLKSALGTVPLSFDRDATSFGYVIGAGWKPLDLSRVGLEWQHDINRLVGSRFRVLATLDVLWIK